MGETWGASGGWERGKEREVGKMKNECVVVKEGRELKVAGCGGDVGRAYLSSSRMASTISLT